MKSTTKVQNNKIQSTSTLWIPLPDQQQELLSGGSPRIRTPNPSGTGDGSPGGSSPAPPIL